MKKILLPAVLAILACSFPVQIISGTPGMTPTSTPPPLPTRTPAVTAEPGSEKNPLILSLSPSPRPSSELLAAGEVIASFIRSRSGYRLVTVAPASELELVQAFGSNNAHIASLSPFAHLLARRNDSVTAVLASVREGRMFYGAQFIANREDDFVPFHDATKKENTADADEALKQLNGKKPCWSDTASPSGYVVPLGLLNRIQVRTRSGAFLEGQPSVVRAVYAGDICDFGATFIDARQSPALEADYPDVMDRVVVIWRLPEVIPYEIISIAASLPLEMRRVLQRAFIDLMLTPEGKAAMQTVYGIDELRIVEDAMYDEFEAYVLDSELDLDELVRQTQP
jgi:phosphonate transport system substrate-binding protein